MKSAISVEIALPASVHEENAWWIANCAPLDVCTQGRTKEEALVNLEDTVVFFIESCFERGTLFQVLREAGFERASDEDVAAPAAPKDRGDGVFVRVPLPFVMGKHAEHRDPA